MMRLMLQGVTCKYFLRILKHYTQTIQSDVLDAPGSAESLEEFQLQVDKCMDETISEAQRLRETLGTGKRNVVHG